MFSHDPMRPTGGRDRFSCWGTVIRALMVRAGLQKVSVLSWSGGGSGQLVPVGLDGVQELAIPCSQPARAIHLDCVLVMVSSFHHCSSVLPAQWVVASLVLDGDGRPLGQGLELPGVLGEGSSADLVPSSQSCLSLG